MPEFSPRRDLLLPTEVTTLRDDLKDFQSKLSSLDPDDSRKGSLKRLIRQRELSLNSYERYQKSIIEQLQEIEDKSGQLLEIVGQSLEREISIGELAEIVQEHLLILAQYSAGPRLENDQLIELAIIQYLKPFQPLLETPSDDIENKEGLKQIPADELMVSPKDEATIKSLEIEPYDLSILRAEQATPKFEKLLISTEILSSLLSEKFGNVTVPYLEFDVWMLNELQSMGGEEGKIARLKIIATVLAWQKNDPQGRVVENIGIIGVLAKD